MSTVIIGMDPRKRSATIEVMDSDETVLGRGRYGTHASGYAAMVRAVRHWPQRTWAIEGCQGIGGHIARRLEKIAATPSGIRHWNAAGLEQSVEASVFI
jgi:hypothetical protein